MNAEMRLRRHAIEIVSQLPESPGDALIVLELARGVVETYLAPQGASGGRTPSLRAISSDRPAGSPSNIHPVVKPGI